MLKSRKLNVGLAGDRVARIKFLIMEQLFELAYVVIVTITLAHAQLGWRHGQKLVIVVDVDGLACEVVFRLKMNVLRLH